MRKNLLHAMNLLDSVVAELAEDAATVRVAAALPAPETVTILTTS
jgi:hypothetical protein